MLPITADLRMIGATLMWTSNHQALQKNQPFDKSQVVWCPGLIVFITLRRDARGCPRGEGYERVTPTQVLSDEWFVSDRPRAAWGWDVREHHGGA